MFYIIYHQLIIIKKSPKKLIPWAGFHEYYVNLHPACDEYAISICNQPSCTHCHMYYAHNCMCTQCICKPAKCVLWCIKRGLVLEQATVARVNHFDLQIKLQRL